MLSFRSKQVHLSGNICKNFANSILFLALFTTHVDGKSLQIELIPTYGDRPLKLASPGPVDSVGRPLSVTRLDFLVSNLQFQSDKGEWLEFKNWFGYFSFGEGRNQLQVDPAPVGSYKAIRFNIGLNPEVNGSDPNQYPPSHPLNPQTNGLHWGWQGGYVFLAFEGHYTRDDGSLGGFSYHIANDKNMMTVQLPLEFDYDRHSRIALTLDLDRLLREQHRIDVAATPSSHSRPGDIVASSFKENAEQALRVASLSSDTFQSQPPPSSLADSFAPPNSSPYQLRVSERFPKIELPRDNVLTEEGVALGEMLFNDVRLSRGEVQSCASCHRQEAAFSDISALSVGAEGQLGKRNSMPLFNLAWSESFFWDGRATELREQALMPIQDHLEMNESLDRVVEKLGRDEEYPSHFQAAFGSSQITPERIGLALEQFLLTSISQNSKFDLALREQTALTDMEKRGLELFLMEYDPSKGLYGADCFHCHGGSLFTNNRFANNGLDFVFEDKGRHSVTGNPADIGKFKVPSLRNVALTAPYMHDGRFTTLEEVVDHYNSGVKPSATLDPNLAKHLPTGLNLSESDRAALVAFLRTLTDTSFQTKTSIAFNTPKISSTER